MTKILLKIVKHIAIKLKKRDILKNTEADEQMFAKIIEYCNAKLEELDK